jgi:hypothetical protein
VDHTEKFAIERKIPLGHCLGPKHIAAATTPLRFEALMGLRAADFRAVCASGKGAYYNRRVRRANESPGFVCRDENRAGGRTSSSLLFRGGPRAWSGS